MAQTALTGENVLLEADLGGQWIPFACVTSLEFYYDTELIEKATVGLQGFKSYVSGMGEWGFTLSTVTHVVPPSGTMYTVFDTLLLSLRKNGLDIRTIYQDNNGNLIEITGHVMIPHTGIASPVDGFSEDTIEMKGSGAFALSTTLTNPGTTNTDLQDPIDYTSPAGGETDFTDPDLVGATLVYVGRDGIDHEVITVGTPNAKQVKFITATGTIVFASPLSQDEWIHILYKL